MCFRGVTRMKFGWFIIFSEGSWSRMENCLLLVHVLCQCTCCYTVAQFPADVQPSGHTVLLCACWISGTVQMMINTFPHFFCPFKHGNRHESLGCACMHTALCWICFCVLTWFLSGWDHCQSPIGFPCALVTGSVCTCHLSLENAFRFLPLPPF